MKHLQRNWIFLKALSVAAFYSINRPAGIWPAIHMMWIGLFSKRQGGVADKVLYIRRTLRCRHCPIYFTKLHTCGSALSENPELGCGCFCDFKNKIKSATCWLDDNIEGDDFIGWKGLF